MNKSAQTEPSVMIRPGLLERLKTNSGIRDDESFARTIGMSRATLNRLRNGEEPSLRAIVGIAQAFGLALGEVVEVVQTQQEKAA